MESKNYQNLCPKPKEKELEKVFISIYDDFFVKSDNAEATEYLRLTNEIAMFEYKIAYLKQALHFYLYNTTTKEMRIDFIEALKVGYDIEIDFNLPFIDEVHRVLSSDIGMIENELSMAKINYKAMTQVSKSKAFDYESQIVSIENVIKRSISDDITLSKYIAYEKSAEKIISNSKKVA